MNYDASTLGKNSVIKRILNVFWIKNNFVLLKTVYVVASNLEYL